MPRTKVTYTPNRRGMDQLARSSSVGDASLDAAKAGQAYAESIAPVGPTGNYSRGFRVRAEQVVVPGRHGGRRAGAVLMNVAPHGWLVEVKNGDAVLARTAAWIEQNF